VHKPSVVLNGRHATGASCPNRDLPHVKMAKNWSWPHQCPDFGLHGCCFRIHLRPQLSLDNNVSQPVSIFFNWSSIYSFSLSNQSTGNFMMMIYSNTIVRATPYLLGMMLAYILAQKMTIKMPNWLVVIEWLLNTALCLTLIYTIAIPYSRDYVYEKLGAAFYASFHRVGWSIGIGWIIWACVNGYAGN
jgi:hypothetical protein